MHWFRRTQVFAARPIYEEGLKRADATDPHHRPGAVHDYFVDSLKAPKPRQVLARGLLVSHHFFNEAPQGQPADAARRALDSAVAQLCPHYQKARTAIAEIDNFGTIMGALTGILAASERTTTTPISFALRFDPLCLQEAIAKLYPAMCIEERHAMRWAQLGDEAIFAVMQRLAALGTPHLAKRLEQMLVQAHRAMPSPTENLRVTPLTHQERQRCDAIDTLLRARQNTSVQHMYSQWREHQTDKARADAMWPEFCRLYVNAFAGQNVAALTDIYTSAAGRRFVSIERRLKPANDPDGAALADRAFAEHLSRHD